MQILSRKDLSLFFSRNDLSFSLSPSLCHLKSTVLLCSVGYLMFARVQKEFGTFTFVFVLKHQGASFHEQQRGIALVDCSLSMVIDGCEQ